MFDLTGKCALVTGASGGIGGAIARALHAQGAAVALSGTRRGALDALAADLGQRAYVTPCDLSDAAAVGTLAGEAETAMGGLDIVVNNAGVTRDGLMMRMSDDDWQTVIEVDLTAAFRIARAALRGMIKRRWGRIIHISSIMGLASKDARNVYSATKAGLLGLARASALDLGTYNITVNCIAPGPFLTDLPGTILTAEQKKGLSDRTALDRWGDPRELAGPALLLASEAGSYITGEVLVVDGGLLVKTF